VTEPQPVMDQAEQDQLIRQVGRALLTLAGEGWKQVRAEYRSAGRHIEVDVFVTGPDGTTRSMRPPMQVVEGLGKLRQGMYRPGRGTWLSAVYSLDPPSRFSVDFEPDIEPRWRRVPPPIGFADELRFFPRKDEHIPDWLRQRLQPPGDQTPPGGTGQSTPPGQTPPGHQPPGQTPPGQIPPGQQAPGQQPPGQQPPGQTPPGQTPPGQQPPPGQPPTYPPPGQAPPRQQPGGWGGPPTGHGAPPDQPGRPGGPATPAAGHAASPGAMPTPGMPPGTPGGRPEQPQPYLPPHQQAPRHPGADPMPFSEPRRQEGGRGWVPGRPTSRPAW
jgi:hypothetical protein